MKGLLSIFRNKFDIFNNTGVQKLESIISTAYRTVLTLMVFKLLLYLSAPNFSFAALFLTSIN